MRTVHTLLLILLVTLLVGLKSCTPDDDNPGNTIVVPEDDPFIPGATLFVPGSEAAEDVEFTITGISSAGMPVSPNDILSEGSNIEKNSLYLALMDRSMGGKDVHLGHPIFGPVVGVSKAEFTGPTIVLEPSGKQFTNPVTITVPLEALGISESSESYEILPILQDENGIIEIPENFSIDFTKGVATVEVTHFSFLRWVKNFFTAASNPLQILSQVNAAQSQLPFPEVTMKGFLVEAILCNSTEFPLPLNKESLSSMNDLLWGLFQGTGPGASATVTTELKNWLWAKYDNEIATSHKPQNYLTFSELFKESLSRSNGDVFKALANANAVLSVYRTSVRIDRTMENYRGDGNDETGARYHFFGAALHSFLYRHLETEWLRTGDKTTLDNFGIVISPGLAVTLEEGIVSGDIVSDTKEYAVDLNGVAFGKLLYDELFSKQQTREQLMSKYNIGENDLDCDHLLVGNWTGSHITTFNCTDPGDNGIELVCIPGEACFMIEFLADRKGIETATLGSDIITANFMWQETGDNSFKVCSLDGSECYDGIIIPPNKIVIEVSYQGSNYCEASIDYNRD